MHWILLFCRSYFPLVDYPEMYTPCLPLTRPDECVHVVGQYMKPIASIKKSGGRGEEGKGINAVKVSPVNGNPKRSQCNQIFHKYDLLLPRLKILPPKPAGKATCFLDKKIYCHWTGAKEVVEYVGCIF